MVSIYSEYITDSRTLYISNGGREEIVTLKGDDAELMKNMLEAASINKGLKDAFEQVCGWIETAKMYTVPDPLKQVPPHIANDLVIVDRVLTTALALAAPYRKTGV